MPVTCWLAEPNWWSVFSFSTHIVLRSDSTTKVLKLEAQSASRMSFPGKPWPPYDLLLDIIHHLDPDHDVGTLRSLSTTLCAPCQRRLFSTIGYRRQYEYILEDLLFRSPHLPFYIRYLDYHCGRDNDGAAWKRFSISYQWTISGYSKSHRGARAE